MCSAAADLRSASTFLCIRLIIRLPCLQVLFYQVFCRWAWYDFLQRIRRASVLANSAVVLVHPFLCDNEEANKAHDQVSLCAFHMGEEGKPSSLRSLSRSLLTMSP